MSDVSGIFSPIGLRGVFISDCTALSTGNKPANKLTSHGYTPLIAFKCVCVISGRKINNKRANGDWTVLAILKATYPLMVIVVS